jgi:hypothetical protein
MKAKGERRRQAAALQGASRIFMHSGEPKDHEVCAQDDSRLIFSHVLRSWEEFGRARFRLMQPIETMGTGTPWSAQGDFFTACQSRFKKIFLA